MIGWTIQPRSQGFSRPSHFKGKALGTRLWTIMRYKWLELVYEWRYLIRHFTEILEEQLEVLLDN